jgi:uncharacterized protein with HEPN domain
MSKDRQILDYLNDILDSIADIKEFVMGMSYENFIEDKKTIKAVIRSLEVIGEAANKTPHTKSRRTQRVMLLFLAFSNFIFYLELKIKIKIRMFTINYLFT